MRIFTSGFLRELNTNYGTTPESDQPYLYWLATDREAEPLRRQIEEWVARLPDTPRVQRLIERLRRAGGFPHARNELAVGHYLSSRFGPMGHRVEYERPLPPNNKTPDWSILGNGQLPEIVVEVFTANLSDTERSEERKWEQFRSRLEQVTLGFYLQLEVLPGCVLPEETNWQEITIALREWLESDGIVEGRATVLQGVRFGVLEFDELRDRLHCRLPVRVFKPNTSALKRNIVAKVNKYKDANLPLVVAVVADNPALDREDLVDALLGQEAVSTRDLGDGITETREIRVKDGLLTGHAPLDPLVSTILWCTHRGLNWRFEPFSCPRCRFPLGLPAATISGG